MRISVKADVREVERQLRGMTTGMPLAVARALNRTIRTVQTHGVRDMAADTKLPQKAIRPAMDLELATRSVLKALVSVAGRRIALIHFRARQTRKGVSYLNPGGRGFLPSGFIATMRSGHRGVFTRTSPARLPIVERFGPSLPFVFTRTKITEALKRVAREAFPKNLAHEVRFLLSRRGAA